MKLYQTITIKDGNGREVEKPIYELLENEVQDYKLIGSSAGSGLWHCFYLGQKYAKDFQNRLFGFRIVENETSKLMNEALGKFGPFGNQTSVIGVDFYEKKEADECLV